MEWVERVNATQTLSAKEPDRLAIGAAVQSLFVAELTMVGFGDPPAFESNNLSKE
jgi:hypothetical protein